MSEEVVLRDTDDSDGVRYLGANLNSDGELMVTGHDLGSGVSKIFGKDLDEYEWIFTIDSEQFPILIKELGGNVGDNVINLIRKKCTGTKAIDLEEVIREKVPHDFWSWIP